MILLAILSVEVLSQLWDDRMDLVMVQVLVLQLGRQWDLLLGSR